MNDSPIPESRRDLVENPGVAVLSTVGNDGYPQSTALWFLLDGEVIRTVPVRSDLDPAAHKPTTCVPACVPACPRVARIALIGVHDALRRAFPSL